AYHQYDEYDYGLPELLDTIAAWYAQRFGVALDPQHDMLRLIGSKEGIAHIALAVLNPGDVAIVPNPGYPVYKIGTLFAGAESWFMPLLPERGWTPDLDAIPAEVAEKAQLLWLCYPNMPTGGTVELPFLEQAVAFAKRHQILICMDMAYSEIYYDTDYLPPSILQVPGAKDVAIEFHSFSKPYNMTGWRLGWACGNPEAVGTLKKFKSYVDSNAFLATQAACAAALRTDTTAYFANLRAMYTRRRDLLVDGLNAAGWPVPKPKAAFYVWAPTPGGMPAADCAAKLLTDCGILATPGSAYGSQGDGYVRFALTIQGTNQEARIAEAVERIKARF
ncbi:MAG TPA: aminotransferase class I/II-fold pyridoxal phosphate-dependent enzyme, partial [Armatimonadota bacterium]|nr:aminotransferase class I/II-fold pyridoxal phosphate-dependent enzyme [Armatimonadota bacterium]